MEKKEKDNEYVDFVVTARKYKTTLTAKYLPGTIVKVEVQQGQEVEAGQLLLIHQAMKMYNRVVAPVAGTIVELGVTEGDKIPKDHLMVKIQPK